VGLEVPDAGLSGPAPRRRLRRREARGLRGLRRDLREDIPALTDVAGPEVRASRRRLATDGVGIAISAIGFAFVYGLAARDAGFSPIEAMAMSTIAFAGAAQFAAVGYVAGGLPWAGIVLLTGLLNARHLLYSASLAPWLRDVPRRRRAVMAHLLTDEAYALTIAHFRRLGWADTRGYWIAAVAVTFIPWNLATLAGVLLGGQIPDPSRFGIDIIFPAAMVGLAVGLITGRREIVAALSGAAIGVVVALGTSASIGIIAGGVIGPLLGLLVPARVAKETAPLGTDASAVRYSMPGTHLEPDGGTGALPDGPAAEEPDR
jgi:4-azaleucine resistance transporter AzlC